MTGAGEAGAVGGAADGGAADLVGMGVAGGLARHDPQAEAFGGVIGGGFQPAVVEDQRFELGAFEEQFPIVGAGQGILQDGQGLVGADVGGIENRGKGYGNGHGA